MPEDALDARRGLNGVDFFMMYAAHDAFTHHLDHLGAALSDGARVKAIVPRWELFKKQLHTHHRAEDAALWPTMRSAVVSAGQAADEVAVLDAMEAEHQQIEPLFDAVDEAIEGGDPTVVATKVVALSAALARHMRHEENAALPLVATYLGQEGWKAFGQDIRRAQGLRDGSVYFPWMLEDAPDSSVTKALGMLPPPVRLLYRFVWLPSYKATYARLT